MANIALRRLPEDAVQTKLNWDSYGADVTAEAALDAAKNFQWTPTVNGGLQLELHTDDEIEIEIDEHGRVASISFQRVND